MLRVTIKQARPGMVLARAIANPRQPEAALLARGFTLTAGVIARLHELGVYDVWVDYPGLEYLDDVVSPELTASQQRLCETLKLGFAGQAQRAGRLPVDAWRDSVRELVDTLVKQPAAQPFVSVLTGVDDVLLRHSAEVCCLGVQLALRLEEYLAQQRKRVSVTHAKDVVNLGIGCLLHDVGETQLPEAERESRRDIDDAGTAWRRHAELGYALLRGQVEPTSAAVVLHHHQHFDGSGFPALARSGEAQAGTKIHIFSRVATAADTLVHLLTKGGIPMPQVYALWRLRQRPLCGWLDPVVLEALLEVVPPFVPGTLVRLSNGQPAVVVKHVPEAPCAPEVVLLDARDDSGEIGRPRERVQLGEESGLAVQEVDGVKVSGYLYGGVGELVGV